MPLNSHQLLKEADRQLADLQANSLRTFRAIQIYMSISREMATASRQLIAESRQLLADTADISNGYTATVYAPPPERRKAA